MALILPETATDKSYTTALWCKIILGLPLLTVAIQTLLLLLYFRYDTPKSCMLSHDEGKVRPTL